MKKLVMFALTILTSGAASALPVGNPSDASLLVDGLFCHGNCGNYSDCFNFWDAISLRFGFYGDYVFNRHLDFEHRDNDQRAIERTRINTNAGLLVLNFYNRFDIFSSLGVSNLWLKTNASGLSLIPSVNGTRIEIETGSDFSWSVGGRGTIFECGCTTLGIEGQYFSFRPDVQRVTIGGAMSAYPDHSSNLKYDEWQVGVGIAHRIHNVIPYIAAKYANVNGDFHISSIGLGSDLEQAKEWGFAAGVSVVDCEKMSLTAEGRFFDELAFHVNGQIRF